jgi:hypothetical protein
MFNFNKYKVTPQFNGYCILPEGWRVLSEKERKLEFEKFRKNYHIKKKLKEKIKHQKLIESSKRYLEKEKDEKWIFELAIENLEKKNNIIERLNQDIEDYKKIIFQKNEIINLNSQNNKPVQSFSKIDLENKQLKKELQNQINKNSQMENEFKDFLISQFSLDTKLKTKELTFIFELIKEKNKIENYNKPTSQFIDKTPNKENKNNSDRCICGAIKSIYAKGCNNCKLKADRIRKRFGISMENAWKEVWKDYENKDDFSQLTEMGELYDNSG